MTDISELADGHIYVAEEAPPSWHDLRKDGPLLIDDNNQKLALYCGGEGAVVLATQEHDDPVIRFIVLDHSFIPDFAAALTKVHGQAAVLSAEWDVKYAAYAAAEAQQLEGEARPA